jgi:hypothetical protein
MAVQTPAHIHIDHRNSHPHTAYITVTGLAVDASRDHMRLMREIHETLKLNDAFPGDWLLAIPKTLQLLDLGFRGVNGLMAAHTKLDTGHTCRWRFQGSIVAKYTIYARLDHGFVGEINRLLVRVGFALGHKYEVSAHQERQDNHTSNDPPLYSL